MVPPIKMYNITHPIPFYDKLVEEMKYIGPVIKIDKIIKKNYNLKGFGDTDYYTITIPEKGEFILYMII